MQPHFSTAEVEEAVAGIAVSFKGGKRAASTGKRYIRKNGKRICVQSGIIIPRGALSEESIYGRISDSATGKHEYVIKYKIGSIALKDVDSVVDKRIREILRERLLQFGGKPEKAFAQPLLDHQGREIRSVRCYTGLLNLSYTLLHIHVTTLKMKCMV
jgi:CRISPR-associated endonuclease Csn1